MSSGPKALCFIRLFIFSATFCTIKVINKVKLMQIPYYIFWILVNQFFFVNLGLLKIIRVRPQFIRPF